MKKILMIAAILLPMLAQALPFVPTSNPKAEGVYWYFVKTNGSYLTASLTSGSAQLMSSANANNDYHLWCFVGDPIDGYHLYNKGMGMYLTLMNFNLDITATSVCYEAADEDSFYLYYISFGRFYLYQREDNGSTFLDVSKTSKGVFSVEQVIEGTSQPDEPAWTRFDANGVGYGIVDGGQGASFGQSSKKLVDGDATTKFYGLVQRCWFVMKASQDVAVKQYSIVMADEGTSNPGVSPRCWKLQGSNDGTTWQDIDVRKDNPLPLADHQEMVFYINDSRKFRYFRFEVTQAASGSYVQLGEVWINKQKHTWVGNYDHVIVPTCGKNGLIIDQCTDCNAKRWHTIPATQNHTYSHGICTICALHEGEVVLLHNGQRVPYLMKAYRGERVESAGTYEWPEPPYGWNQMASFNDSQWLDVPMPTASYNHSGGPTSSLVYNSHWFGEYNCYFFRRTFGLAAIDDSPKFTFNCVHDDNMIVYVNGQEVINAEGWTSGPENGAWLDSYDSFTIPASAFHVGDNVLAIYIQQNWGGAYFDCELIGLGVTPGVSGDVNGDGRVNVSDVSALINMILGLTTMDNYRADVNGDGRVNVSDVSALINIILGIH